MTLNGVMAVILHYFSEFGYLPGALHKSSRSLSHLLMSSRLDFAIELIFQVSQMFVYIYESFYEECVLY